MIENVIRKNKSRDIIKGMRWKIEPHNLYVRILGILFRINLIGFLKEFVKMYSL